jgi:sRNA-binding regulator protein Hfq
MSLSATLPVVPDPNVVSDPKRTRPESGAASSSTTRVGRGSKALGTPVVPAAHANFAVEGSTHRQAELFYLQKQIHAQTPMVIVLEDGERVEGIIEWYDQNSIKVRGRVRSLVYKSAIKYMYKVGEGV